MRTMQQGKSIIQTYYHLLCNVMFKIKMKTKILKVHECRFENLSISLCSCKSNNLKISHS